MQFQSQSSSSGHFLALALYSLSLETLSPGELKCECFSALEAQLTSAGENDKMGLSGGIANAVKQTPPPLGPNTPDVLLYLTSQL